jgi:hypothetical protein
MKIITIDDKKIYFENDTTGLLIANADVEKNTRICRAIGGVESSSNMSVESSSCVA